MWWKDNSQTAETTTKAALKRERERGNGAEKIEKNCKMLNEVRYPLTYAHKKMFLQGIR